MSRTLRVDERLTIVRAIADFCSFQLMANLTEICYGRSVIHTFAAPTSTQLDIAQASMDWAQREGIEINLIAVVVRAAANTEEKAAMVVRETVGRVLPEALSAPPSVALKVEQVVIALNSLRTSLNDNKVRAKIFNSKASLNAIIDSIHVLVAYKGLHDSLHRVQLKSKWGLVKAIRMSAHATSTGLGTEYLRDFLTQVLATIEASRMLIRQFEHKPELKQREVLWIDQMDAAARKYEKGLEDNNRGAIRIGLNIIYALLDEQSPRLNGQIFSETIDLRLNELEGLLEQVALASPSLSPHIASMLAAINELRRTLVGRVAAHNQLQIAERDLSILAECLEHREDEGVLPEFADLWPETKERVVALSIYNPDFAGRIIDAKLIDSVDCAILDLAVAGGQSDQKKLIDRLENAFSRFHEKARLQFYQVDTELKADFGELEKIARSLQSVLGDLP